MKPEIVELNLEGEICPYTLIKTIRKSVEIDGELKVGSKALKVMVDHFQATDNFSHEFRGRGFKVKIEKVGSSKWTVIINV